MIAALILALAIAPGLELETRIDGDLDGDGRPDTVYVERGEEVRRLHVLLGGTTPAGVLEMDPYPVQRGEALLEITKKGVLVVGDLTGGSSATSSTYRFRYDGKAGRMRLIGLDAKFYSRTNRHGWSSASWNLLTGDYVEESAELIETPTDAAYADPVVTRGKRPTGPVYMEDTPSGESLIMGE